jgi:hypothetical protein
MFCTLIYVENAEMKPKKQLHLSNGRMAKTKRSGG